MCTHIVNAYSAATRTNRGLRFFPFSTGRPLFAILAIAAAAIGITVLLFPAKLTDYEPFREESVEITGTVCGLEPKKQEDETIWRMILTDVRIESTIGETDTDNSHSEEPPAGRKAAEAGFGLSRKDKVLCIFDREPEAEMSAMVCLRGKLYPFRAAMNEGEFDLRKYYHILRIEFSLRDADLLAVSEPTGRLDAILFHFKNHISSIIDRLFSKENSPVLKAMLLGEKGMLEEETKELYQGAGIVHILSISGLHLSLLGMGIFSLTGKCSFIPLPVRAALSISAIYLYGKMIGMGTSVFRALIMLTLYIISRVLGRTYDLLTAASIAAFLLLLDQPLYILHTGFQFSFGAVLAIGILLPALPGRILKAVAIPLATLPVYLWAYGTFPATSLFLNMIVIPLMAVVMVSAGGTVLLAGLTGFFSGGTGDVLSAGGILPSALSLLMRFWGLPAELILDFYRFLAETSEKIPGHEIVPGRPSPIRILLFYCLLIVMAYVSVRLQMPHMRRRIEAEAVLLRSKGPSLCPEVSRKGSRRSRRNESRTDLFLRRAASKTCRIFRLSDNRSRKNFACVCTALWITAAILALTIHPRPVFEMDMLYVGQGDGIFISCQGRNFLIDGGSSTKEELAKYTLLPFLHSKGLGHLDGIILTHDDSDHCSGLLELLEAAAEDKPAISISAVYLPDIAESAKGENYRRIEDLSLQAGIPIRRISRGQRIRAGSLTLDCLHPALGASYEDANEYSTTLLLKYGSSSHSQEEDSDSKPDLSADAGSFSALLTGDLEGQGEKELLDYLAVANLLQSIEDQPNIDVLKVAHHGSRNATSAEFLQAVRPDTAIISSGINNMYGHPSEELLSRLKTASPQPDIYRTDLQGGIYLQSSKGGEYRISTFLDN